MGAANVLQNKTYRENCYIYVRGSTSGGRGCQLNYKLSENIEKMNKQQFKKAVEEVGASICNEMMTVYYNVKGADQDKVSKAVAKVLGATGAAKANANKFFGKSHKAFGSKEEYVKEKQAYFKQLFKTIHADFNSEISAALKLFNEAVPQDVKDAQKAGA